MKQSRMIAVFAILTGSLMLSACQATPETDIVVQKDGVVTEAAAGSGDSIDAYDAPERWEETLTYDNSPLNVIVDAEVIVPELTQLPIYRCNVDVPMPQDKIDKVIQYFWGNDGQLVDAETGQALNTDISQTNSEGKYIFSGHGTDMGGYDRSIFVSSLDNEEMGTRIEVYGKRQMLYTTDSADMHQSDGTISQEDAVNQAQELLAQLGIENMQVSESVFRGRYEDVYASAPSEFGYRIVFSRIADGMICHSSNYMGDASGNSFSAAIYNEAVSVGVTASGIWEFSWVGYFELGDKIAENAALIAFDEIKGYFESAMKLAHSYDSSGRGDWMDYRVTQIKLGYSKTAIRNEPGQCKLIPVWNFYGDYLAPDGNWYSDSRPFMSIDAVSGGIA